MIKTIRLPSRNRVRWGKALPLLLSSILLTWAPFCLAQDTSGSVHEKIRKLLADSAAAQEKDDLESATDLARQAEEISRKVLSAQDKDRAIAVRTLGRLRCAAALKTGDVKTALEAAESVRRDSSESGDLENALVWARYASDLARRLDETQEVKENLNKASLILERLLVEKARNAGNTRNVLEHQLEVVRLTELVLPAGDPQRIQDLMELAIQQQRTGATESALKRYDQIIAETNEAPQQNLLARLVSLINSAGLLVLENGREADAQRRLVDAAKALPPSEATNTDLLTLVDELFWSPAARRAERETDPEAAESWFKNLLIGLKTLFREAGVPPSWEAHGTLVLARLQFGLQRIEATEATLATLENQVSILEPATLLMGDYFTLRGNVEVEKASYGNARNFLYQAYSFYQEAKHKRQAPALNNLGQLLIRQGDYPTAHRCLQVSVNLYEKQPGFQDNIGLAFALTNLGKAVEGKGEARDAERFHRQALERLKQTAQDVGLGTEYPEFLAHMNLGVDILSLGDFNEAASEFDLALKLALDKFGPHHFHTAEVKVNLGWVAYAQEKYEQARADFIAALKIFQTELGKEHPRTAEAMGYLARVDCVLGNREEATKLLTEALDLRENYVRRMFRSALSDYDRLALVRALRIHSESPAYSGVLDTFLELAPQLEIPSSEQYRRMLAWKGIVAGFAPVKLNDLEDDGEIRTIARQREATLKKLRSAATGASTTDLALLEGELDTLDRKLGAMSPRFQRSRDTVTVSPTDIAGHLEPTWAMLDILQISLPRISLETTLGDRRYVGFLTRKDESPIRVDFGGQDASEAVNSGTTIDDSITELRNALDRTDDQFKSPAETLSSFIKMPLKTHLGGIDLLIVSADGMFHRLPLGVLPGDQPGAFWIEEMAFTSIPSPRSLNKQTHERDNADQATLLVLGGLNYGEEQPAAFIPLPATAKEADQVARLFGQDQKNLIDMMQGKDASLARVLESLPVHRFVHIATPGFFNGSEEDQDSLRGVSAMLDSGLVLSGANSRQPDTLLSSEQIALLDLQNVDLVVLSACQSALGHVKAGQGTTGLLDAFERAGAKCVICALWKVDDEATASLMVAFYEKLLNHNHPPIQALREAQLQLIREQVRSSSGLSFANPHFWASFEVCGVPTTQTE